VHVRVFVRSLLKWRSGLLMTERRRSSAGIIRWRGQKPPSPCLSQIAFFTPTTELSLSL
jgi:hypothetical protein